jgi:HAD superfamily hydrolase (TIGR01549 family)
MNKKAILLDFYGTVVHEDEQIIKVICDKIFCTANKKTEKSDIGSYWWKSFYELYTNAYEDKFKTQRELEFISLDKTINFFESSENSSELSELMFNYWRKPSIFNDSKEFFEKVNVPICIVSNIDRLDIECALQYHNLNPDFIVTSEDVRSYKPRTEIFNQALSLLSLSIDEVIHIGDSISSDIFGAKQLGISAVWMNRENKPLPNEIKIDFIANDLLQVLDLI